MKYTFVFSCNDNGGKSQCFKVKASDKHEAIQKGFEKAKKNAKSDICPSWKCELDRSSLL